MAEVTLDENEAGPSRVERLEADLRAVESELGSVTRTLDTARRERGEAEDALVRALDLLEACRDIMAGECCGEPCGIYEFMEKHGRIR